MSSQKRASVFLFLKYGLFSLTCFSLGLFVAVALQDMGIFAGTADAAINFVRVDNQLRSSIEAMLTILLVSALGLGLIAMLKRSEKAPVAILQALALVPLMIAGYLIFSAIPARKADLRVLVLLMAFFGGGVVLALTHQVKRDRQSRRAILASLGVFIAVIVGGLVVAQPKRLPLPRYYSSANNTSEKVLESVLDKAQVRAVAKALNNPYIKHWVKEDVSWMLVDEAFGHAASYEYRDGHWRLHVNVNFSQKDALDLKCAVGASREGSMWSASGAFERGAVRCRNNAIFFKTDLNGKLTYASTRFLNREVIDGLSLFFKPSYDYAKKHVLADEVFLKWAGAVERVEVAKKTFYLNWLSQYVFRDKGMLASLDIKTSTRDLRCLSGQTGSVRRVNNKLTWVGEPMVSCVDRISGQVLQRRKAAVEEAHMLTTQTLPERWMVEAARAKLINASGLKKVIGDVEYTSRVKLVEHKDYRGAMIDQWAFHRVIKVSEAQTVQMLLFAVHIDDPLMCAVFVPQKGTLPARVRMLGIKDPHTTMTTCWSTTHQHQFFENGTFYRSTSLEKFLGEQPIIAQNKKVN